LLFVSASALSEGVLVKVVGHVAAWIARIWEGRR
jgi:hypothetical protein